MIIKSDGNIEMLQDFISEKATILVFYSPECETYEMIAPALQEIADEKKATIVKLDVDALQSLKEIYGIVSVPTYYVFKNGVRQHIHTGFATKETLLELISSQA